MQLSDEQVRDFAACWKRDFGEDLSPDSAREQATRLLAFFAALAEAFAIPPAAATESEEGASTLQ